jgi:hypothetical protein
VSYLGPCCDGRSDAHRFSDSLNGIEIPENLLLPDKIVIRVFKQIIRALLARPEAYRCHKDC